MTISTVMHRIVVTPPCDPVPWMLTAAVPDDEAAPPAGNRSASPVREGSPGGSYGIAAEDIYSVLRCSQLRFALRTAVQVADRVESPTKDAAADLARQDQRRLMQVQVVAGGATLHNPLSRRLSEACDKIDDMDSEDAPEVADPVEALNASVDRPGGPWVMPREYDIGGVRWFSDASRELARALHPLLAQVTREELAEGPPPQTEGAPLPEEASSLYRPMAIRHEWTVSIEDVAAFNRDQFLADLYALADSMGGQMVRGMLEHISAVTEEHGNTIDAGGRDFFDVVAETLETIEMTFDDEGRPNLTIVMHPDQAEKLRDKQPTPEQEARLDAILERRKEEWLASRRRRDLP